MSVSFSLLLRSRQVSEGFTQLIGRTVGGHITICDHEVSVSINVVQAVEVGHGLLGEGSLDVGGSGGSELSEPKWLAWGGGVNLRDVALEVVEVVVSIIPMDRDEIDGAAGALLQELSQPRETSVADSWGTELGLASELLHVRPAADGLGDRHGATSVDKWLIRLVEPEEVFGAVVDGGLGGLRPAVGLGA